MDGNTKMIAKMIHEKTGADMVMLNTVIPYTGADEEIVQQGREEVNRGHLPDLEPLPVHLAEYDTIILGTPGGIPWRRLCTHLKEEIICQERR